MLRRPPRSARALGGRWPDLVVLGGRKAAAFLVRGSLVRLKRESSFCLWPLRRRLLLSALQRPSLQSLSCSCLFLSDDEDHRRCCCCCRTLGAFYSFDCCYFSSHVDSVRVATATQIVVACSVGKVETSFYKNSNPLHYCYLFTIQRY